MKLNIIINVIIFIILKRNSKTNSKRKKILKHLGNVGLAAVSAIIMTSTISAAVDSSEVVNQVIGCQGD